MVSEIFPARQKPSDGSGVHGHPASMILEEITDYMGPVPASGEFFNQWLVKA
jgi:hypothetical protein